MATEIVSSYKEIPIDIIKSNILGMSVLLFFVLATKIKINIKEGDNGEQGNLN